MKTQDYSKWTREQLQNATEARSAQAQKAAEADDRQGVAVANAAYYAIKFELASRNHDALQSNGASLTTLRRAEQTAMFFMTQANFWESLALGVLEGAA